MHPLSDSSHSVQDVKSDNITNMDKLDAVNLAKVAKKHKTIVKALFRLPEKHKLDKSNWENY